MGSKSSCLPVTESGVLILLTGVYRLRLLLLWDSELSAEAVLLGERGGVEEQLVGSWLLLLLVTLPQGDVQPLE